MPPKSRLESERAALAKFFAAQDRRVYTGGDLAVLLTTQLRDALALPRYLEGEQFTRFLCDRLDMREVELEPTDPRYTHMRRYVWGDVPFEAIAVAIKRGAYLSHASAAVIHALLPPLADEPVYVNKEQSPKPPPKGGLTQDSIDRAFRNRPRHSNFEFRHNDRTLVLLAGKSTSRLEVGPAFLPTRPIKVDATSIERTLADLVVRPNYARGPRGILTAFQRARGRLDPERLVRVLEQLGHIYPYHQSIGFFMERAGFDANDLRRVAALPRAFNFYASYQMASAAFDATWRVFYPAEFDTSPAP